MKRTSLFLLCTFFSLAIAAVTVTPAASLPAYYEDLQGKSGKSLFDAVHVVAKEGYSSLGYKGLWTAYKTTDLRDNGKIWDMYSDCDWTYSDDQCGNYSSECDCYNREHSIPKSWFGGAESQPGCDIFHIVPTDGKVNGMRGNYAFGEVASEDYTYDGAKRGSAKSITIMGGNTIAGNTGATISCSASTVFEPRDEYKGDFARGYFGTMIKWAGDYQAFTKGDGGEIFSSNYSTGAFGLTQYGVALLMKWHRQDPVSKKEIDRNNGIQQTQGNRNPFIDYPYLAEYIWGEKAGETLNLNDLITAYDARFVLGESNGYLKGGSTVDPEEKCTITWLVNGEAYTDGNPTISVNEGGVVAVLPTAPASCDEISNQFVGWSENLINGTQDEVPEDLFSTPDDAPDIVQNTTFYAVFAQLTTEEANSSNSSSISLEKSGNQDGWTLYNLGEEPKYWRMVDGSYVESPVIDLTAIDSITITMRTYGGDAYNTIDIFAENEKLGSLIALNKVLNNYTLITSSKLTGEGKLHFSSPTAESKYAPGFSQIVVHMKGTSTTYTYSRYITSCNVTPTENVKLQQTTQKGNKILSEGQLLIEYNGMYYNTLGQTVNK